MVRVEEYVLGLDSRKCQIFEREQISRAFLNLKWTKHIQMGCEQTGIGHFRDISSLDIDDGDQMLILGSYCGSVTVTRYKNLERKKWKKPMQLNLESEPLKTIKWCPVDLRLFMVSTFKKSLNLCDALNERVLHSGTFDGPVHFDWNSHQTHPKVAVADGSRTMKIVDFRVGISLPQIVRWDDVPIDMVQWFPSKQNYVYIGRQDGRIGVFDIRSTRGVLMEKQIHGSKMFGMKITPDGRHLISGDTSGRIHVADTWDLSTKFEFRGFFNPKIVANQQLEVLAIGKDLFVATNFEKLTILKFSKGKLEKNEQSRFLEIAPCALKDQAMRFRRSSYELIAGHNYNYLNILSLGVHEDTSN
ncbi:hypothetical protein L3Y34_016973 [Caenorhabditis briggsae]|uniref:Uncharacterized protein n=2 Tax=Caenorhabditis briggsae TaxID=6238 RepID=A0AAE9ISD3_CAEBR|nr:hypothetical protein L3Y34_016973 [Caenorhabditis briggsae]ULU03866.1 hypothetical protein L3Y34_016973 [Caenorhabditis briggsae]